MNMVSDMAGSNLYLAAIKMHFPIACEFYKRSHPQSSNCKNKNWDTESGEQWHPPSPIVFVFFLCTKHVPSCYKGVKDLVILKCTVCLMQLMPHSLQDAVQVSSPKFIGRDVSFLGSGLRSGCQWVDSWGDSSEQPRLGRWGNWGWWKAIGLTQGAGVSDPSSYKSVSSGNPEPGVLFFILLR